MEGETEPTEVGKALIEQPETHDNPKNDDIGKIHSMWYGW